MLFPIPISRCGYILLLQSFFQWIKMKIKKIKKLHNHRIFRDFEWRGNNPPQFERKNLIYGWNGTGKSTLSELFRAIEKRKNIAEGEVVFDFEDIGTVRGDEIESKSETLPDVRVFNAKYVKENVYLSTGKFDPIYILGEGRIDEEQKLKLKEKELNDLTKPINDSAKAKKVANDNRDRHCIEMGRSIKNLLLVTKNDYYISYNKAKYNSKAERMNPEDIERKTLTEERKAILHTSISQRPPKPIEQFRLTYPNTIALADKVNKLITQNLVVTSIEKLQKDSILSDWVAAGLNIHTARESKECLFCEQTLPSNRLSGLSGHFNNEFQQLIDTITSLSGKIDKEYQELKETKTPNSAALLESLREAYEKERKSYLAENEKILKYFDTLKSLLETKRKNPFSSVVNSQPVCVGNQGSIDRLLEIIKKHNDEIANHSTLIEERALVLEEHEIAASLLDYNKLEQAYNDVNEADKELLKEKEKIEEAIRKLEIIVQDFGPPAELLTTDIQNCLGSNELSIEV